MWGSGLSSGWSGVGGLLQAAVVKKDMFLLQVELQKGSFLMLSRAA